jgi:DNA-binding NarL/FixJ family response regulator
VISVLIADDQALVRGGFRIILDSEPDIEVVGEAEDGLQAVELAGSLGPDVVLMDIRMPGMDGITATTRLLARTEESPPRVLILTTFDHDEYLYDAIRAGASGFLLKNVSPSHLVHGVRTIAAGDALLDPALTRKLLDEFTKRPAPGARAPERLSNLTDREIDVLRLVARGLSNNDIAHELVVAAATVKTHVSNILAKLDIHDRVQAVVIAYETGLITPGQFTQQ